MIRLRFQRKRLILVVFCLVLVFIFHHFGNNTYGNSIYLKNGTNDEYDACVLPEDVHKNMIHLVEKVLNTLDALHVSYFLCYESLWGALKSNAPLPWQRKLELCVFNSELVNIDEVFLVRTFKRHGLLINYNIANGVYTVTMPEVAIPYATLTVFELDPITQKLRRVGWTHRLLPPNACHALHCFPSDLIEPPLEELPFLTVSCPVPHEGIEIQKYLFPDSWWKDIQPPKCVENSKI